MGTKVTTLPSKMKSIEVLNPGARNRCFSMKVYSAGLSQLALFIDHLHELSGRKRGNKLTDRQMDGWKQTSTVTFAANVH